MQSIGERLEEARKKKGISIREAAEATKIRGDYLQQFENNRFDINLTEIYVRGFLRAYAASKLAQVLFVLQFAEEMRGTGVAANLFHPGVVATGIFKGRTVFAKLLDAYMQRTALSPEEGAAWGIRLASASEYAGRTGGFYAKEGLQGLSRRMRDRTLRARFVAATREAAEEDGAGRKAPPP